MLGVEARGPQMSIRWHPRKLFGLPPAGEIAFKADATGLCFVSGSGPASLRWDEIFDLAILPRFRPADAEGVIVGGYWFASWRARDIVDMRLLLRGDVVKIICALQMNEAEIAAMLDFYNATVPSDINRND